MAIVIKRLTLALAILCGLFCSLASAEDGCRVFTDKGDRLAFGHVPLGGERKKSLSSVPQSNCFLYECYYEAPDGIEYTVIDEKIVKKELNDGALASYRGSLIAGIAWHDTLDVVRQKLESLPEGFRSWEMFKQNGGDYYFLVPQACLQASNGTIWRYVLLFDENARLFYISAFVDGYETPT